ncbi:MAG: sugar ABC transporter permease [Trueperaceae bacterium]|nr:sugar ABC transporter permease [Trueperaceae bacterium]
MSQLSGSPRLPFAARVQQLVRDGVYDKPAAWRFSYLLILPGLIVILTMLGIPLVYAFVQSLYRVDLLRPGTPFVGLQNYVTVFNSPQFWSSLRLTFIFVAGTMTMSFVLGMATSLLLNRELRGFAVLRALVILPFIVSEVTVGITWRWLFAPDLGVINAMLAVVSIDPVRWLSDPNWAMFSVILAETWRLTPFAILILLAGLQSVDKSFYEAARVDGANFWHTFRYITLPNIKPQMLITLIYLSFACVNQFGIIFSLTGGGPGRATEVVALYMYDAAFGNFQFSRGSTMAVLLFAVNVVLSLTYMRVLRTDD